MVSEKNSSGTGIEAAYTCTYSLCAPFCFIVYYQETF